MDVFCIGFIDFLFAGKNLTDFTNIFSPNNSRQHDDMVLNCFVSNA